MIAVTKLKEIVWSDPLKFAIIAVDITIFKSNFINAVKE